MTILDRIENRIRTQVEKVDVCALALCVVRDGDPVLEMGTGQIETEDGLRKVSVDTPFPSCSTGKAITATAILKLVEEGVLDLDRPVVDYVPWLQYPAGGDCTKVNIRSLLSHTSGLSSDPDIPSRFFENAACALEEYVREDVPTYAAVPPGEICWYSNPGFNIAGYIAEKVTGTPFPALVDELVAKPLGMRTTSFDPNCAAAALATRALRTPFRIRRLPVPYPAGGAVTTVRDLCRFAQCHLDGGHAISGRLLNQSTIEQMQSVFGDAYCRTPRRYGLGFDIETYNGRKLVTHGGGGFGCGSMFAMLPDKKIAVAALFNHPAGFAISARDIFDEVLELAPDEKTKVKRISQPFDESYVGIFQNVIEEADGYPKQIAISVSEGKLWLATSGEASQLVFHDDRVYVTWDQSASVGFAAGGRYLMFDPHGLALVSAWPYIRIE